MRLLAVVLVVLAAAGCDRPPGQAGPRPLPGPTGVVTAPPPGGGEHDAAVARWRDFPLSPRPLLFPYEPWREAGFRTITARLAAQEGLFEPPPGPLPTGPAAVTAELPDGPLVVPAIGAAAAFEALRRNASPTGRTPLRVLRVELRHREVRTDRGPATLPFRAFAVAEAAGYIEVPALDPAHWRGWDPSAFDGPIGVQAHDRAVRNRDGTITVFLQDNPMPCPGHPAVRHEARVTETASVVVVGYQEVPGEPVPGRPDQLCAQTLDWGADPHTLRLAVPLGGRVLSDPDGRPITVTAAP
ncbi:MAG TPA: hypothetical protein VGD67_04470 [Pseudonocardiaceae bacterium]